MNDQSPRPCIFGEVLFDRFPDGSEVLGGAPFNVAWNLQAFGIRPYFVSRIGNDELGEKIQSEMQTWGMDIAGMQVDAVRATGTVDISIKDNEPNFNILANTAYDNIDATGLPTGAVSMIYHGSLALRDGRNRETLRALKSTTQAPVFMDVNLRDPWWNEHELHELLSGAHWVKLNENELETLSAVGGDLQQQVKQLQQAHDIELVIVTLGSEGGFASTADGTIVRARPTAELEIVDTVGAGDAFASVCIVGLLKGWDTAVILERAQAFASAVVGLRGATTTDRSFYQQFVSDWD
jgi:fructokinase